MFYLLAVCGLVCYALFAGLVGRFIATEDESLADAARRLKAQELAELDRHLS